MKRTTRATKRYTSCVMAVMLCASVAAFATPGFTTVYENGFSAPTSRRRRARLRAEEIVQTNLRMNKIRVFVALDARSRDHGQTQ